jgi:hypothetical protein
MIQLQVARTKEDAMFYLMVTGVEHRRSGDPIRTQSWPDNVMFNILCDYVDAHRARIAAQAQVLNRTINHALDIHSNPGTPASHHP